jgi:hypothetical protein
MCLNVRKKCDCGEKNVQFHLRDNVMEEKVLVNLFCPSCSSQIKFDYNSMLYDNGWILEYDMEMAKFFAAEKLNMEPDFVRPGFLFDEGYFTWQEMYPGEKKDIEEERLEIIKLLEKDKKQYLIELSNWNISRINRLKKEGWRKVQHA